MEDGVPVRLLKILSRIKSPHRNKFSVELKKKKHLRTSLSLQPQRIKQTEESTNFVTSDGLLRLSQVPVQFVGLKDCHFHFNCKYQ
jgi:hypothetical protein